jgi:hypothetical protein
LVSSSLYTKSCTGGCLLVVFPMYPNNPWLLCTGSFSAFHSLFTSWVHM